MTGTTTYTVTDGSVAGRGGDIRVRDYTPDKPLHDAAFLWVHGGGFAYGGLDQKESDAPARYLAAAGWRVRAVDYRLAPKIGLFGNPVLGKAPGRFPAAHHDVLDVAAALVAETGSPISIGGASAGANIVAGVLLALRDAGTPLPLSAVLFYGAFHSVHPDDPAIESGLRGPLVRWMFNDSMIRRIALNYVGDEGGLADPLAFPGTATADGTADLAGLPPTLSVDASNDRLRRSGHAFHQQLAAAGVVTEELVVNARHGFLGQPRSAAFAEGMAATERWLSR